MEYEIAANNTRVYSVANTTIQDNFTAERVVKYLKMRNAWASLAELWLPCSGLKIGGNPLIASDMYSVKGLHDLSQSTGASQPLYSANSLVFDGIDDILTKAITKDQLLALTSSGDFTFQFVGRLPQLANGTNIAIFTIYASTTNNIIFRCIGVDGTKMTVRMALSANAAGVSATSPNAFTYDANTLLQITIQYTASTGGTEFFINGSSIGTSSTMLGDINNLDSASFLMNIFRTGTPVGAMTFYGAAFFKGIISPSSTKLEVV